jgi:hypothetical protein
MARKCDKRLTGDLNRSIYWRKKLVPKDNLDTETLDICNDCYTEYLEIHNNLMNSFIKRKQTLPISKPKEAFWNKIKQMFT